MKNTVQPELISLRDLSEQDAPLLRDYWFRSPEGFIESLGVDFSKMPSEAEFERGLINKCRENASRPSSKLNALIILYDEKPVGFHTMTPVVEGDYGIFHAHVWDTQLRGRSLGVHTYPKACRIFLDRFDLKRILFKTPKQNLGAIRVKEKLGIPLIGEEVINFGIYREGTLSQVYELTRPHADRL